jgi:hypothetical protein
MAEGQDQEYVRALQYQKLLSMRYDAANQEYIAACTRLGEQMARAGMVRERGAEPIHLMNTYYEEMRRRLVAFTAVTQALAEGMKEELDKISLDI